MAMTQFAMVEELASLIKDNLYSKHLILSTEEALIDSLRDDASVGGMLELQPTSPYHRLLLHRLADIYGFAHESVGEGDDRHLVLQRCLETAIPSVLVSDILWHYDDDDEGNDFESPTSSLQMLRREDDFVVKPMQSLTLSARLEERETAYREARNRIFEKDDGIVPKTRKVPVVARRMIAHALGQRIPSHDEKFSSTRFEENAVEDSSEKSASPSEKSSLCDIKLSHESSRGSTSCNGGAGSSEKGNGDAFKSSKSKSNSIGNESNGRAAGAENMQKEQMGAAKRIFAHALRLPSGVSASATRVNERGGALRRET